jgi:hypothetical protein
MLFRWFLVMNPDEDVFVPTVFTHNRERLAEHRLTQRFFYGVVRQAIDAELVSVEHFVVDGSPIQSHASLKNLKRIAREGDAGNGDDDDPSPNGGPRRKSRNEPVVFRGERCMIDTHRSTTDPESRLYRKPSGVGAFLSRSMHALAEKGNGLVLSVEVSEANVRSEPECAQCAEETQGGGRDARRRHELRRGRLPRRARARARARAAACRGVRRADPIRRRVRRRAPSRARSSAKRQLRAETVTPQDPRRVLRLAESDRPPADTSARRALEDQATGRADGGGVHPVRRSRLLAA